MDHPNPDRYLSTAVREHLEQAYYARVSEQARMENLIRDTSFLTDSEMHPAFYSDHGVVHVRDVTRQILHILELINGVLIPRRNSQHMESFLYGYGVVLAYFHDIGMHDLSSFGRAMHPEFAAQAVFGESLHDVVERMWQENSGNIAWHLTTLSRAGALRRDPRIVFRELLAMSVGHSKSKVPVSVLDSPPLLRKQMQQAISQDLQSLFAQQQEAKGRSVPAPLPRDHQPPGDLQEYYADFEREAFDWLIDESVEARQLVQDVTDTLRALRCADAFRQRGTVEKTSGGYEIFTSQKTGNCVIALRLGASRLYLMELPDNPAGAGESNIASSEFNAEGNIRISFHRGAFENQQAQDRSAYSTAYVINDLLQDAVDSFWRAESLPGVKRSTEILVLLENTDDEAHFAELVLSQICQLSPKFADQMQVVPSLRNVSDSERRRYLAASELDWGVAEKQHLLHKMNEAGQKLTSFDPAGGFRHVRLSNLQAGDRLIGAGEPSAFVYVPLDEGLRIVPLGGYQSFSVAAWMPLGTTGVIRGDIRNADVVSEEKVSVLIIPKEVYLRHWYDPCSPSELRKLLTGG